MKIKSLLAAVSMVAITAGSASALSIPTTAAELGLVTNPNPTTAISSPQGVALASELEVPLEGIGDITFSVVTDSGDYPSGNNFIVDIALPSGLAFDDSVAPVSGSLLVGPAGGSAVVQNLTGSTVQLFVSIPQSSPIGALDFSIPVSMTSCTISGDLVVDVATEGDTNVENGTAMIDSPIESCESAFDTDFDPDANDTLIALTDYEFLRNLPTGGQVTASVVGLYDAAIDTSVGIDIAGTPLTAASIDTVDFDICFADGSEITDVRVNGFAGTASADGNTWSFSLDHTADLTDANIRIDVSGTDPITSQPILVKNIVHNFTDAGGPDLIESEIGTNLAPNATPPVVNVPLDFLQREGQSFGVFDWNSGPAGALTNSVYRITGLEPGVPTTYTATLYNSFANGGAAYTLAPATVTGDDSGEAVLTSIQLPGIPATISRYDLGLNFETGRSLDVDRLMSAGGVITDFGGGANTTDATLQGSPSADADN